MTLTASAVPRVLACPGSLALPHADYQTKYADDGEDRHAEMEAAADIGDVDALPDAVRALIREGDELLTEASLAYDVSTDSARRLVGRRVYAGLAPYEIPGTPDLIVVGAGRAAVIDYKSFEEVESAATNTQTLTYALAVARLYGLDEIAVAIVYLGGMRAPSIATLGSLDLDAHAERLREAQRTVAIAAASTRAGGTDYLRTGSHCRYCPAFVSCPLQRQLAERIDTLVPLEIEAAIPFQDDDEAADAFDLLGRITLLAKRIRAALYARAAERPIPLRNGKLLGSRQKEGNRQIDADKAYALIRQRYGQEVADAAVQRSVAQKWIEDALKQAGVQAPKKAKDALVAELEKAGAVTREPKTVIEEHDAPALMESA